MRALPSSPIPPVHISCQRNLFGGGCPARRFPIHPPSFRQYRAENRVGERENGTVPDTVARIVSYTLLIDRGITVFDDGFDRFVEVSTSGGAIKVEMVAGWGGIRPGHRFFESPKKSSATISPIK